MYPTRFIFCDSKLTILALFAMMAVFVVVMPAYGVDGADGVSRDRLDELKAEYIAILAQSDALETSGQVTRSDLEALDRRLGAARQESQRLEEQATALELKLLSLRVQRDTARQYFLENQTALSAVMASLARSGRHYPPAWLTQPQNVNKAVRAAILMGEIAPQMHTRVLALSEEIISLRRLEEEVLQQARNLADAETALAAQQTEIVQLSAVKQLAYDDISHNSEALRLRAESLGQQVQTLEGLLAALEVQAPGAPRLKPGGSLTRQALAGDRRGTTPPAAAGALTSLDVPGAARMVRTWGQRLPGGANSEGIAFATESGAQIAAPSDGVIEFAGPFRSYGQLLILSTGNGYHILLSGMASHYVTVGQLVKKGDLVARMTERDGALPELYMEVRKSGKPVNPALFIQRS